MDTNNGNSRQAFIAQLQQIPQTPSASKIQSISDLTNFWKQPKVNVTYLDGDNLVIEGTMVMFTGLAGHGKTTFITALARDLSDEGRPILFLDRENPIVAVQERFERLRITPRDNFHVWGVWERETAVNPASPIVTSWISQCNLKPVIVIDSLISFLDGCNENQSAEVRQVMDKWRLLTTLGATVVIIHHAGKAETSEKFRGASGILDCVDCAYLVTNRPANGQPVGLGEITIAPFKSRIGLAESKQYQYAEGTFRLLRSGGQVGQKKIAAVIGELLSFDRPQRMSALASAAAKEGITRDAVRDYVNNQVNLGTILREGAGPTTQYRLSEEKLF